MSGKLHRQRKHQAWTLLEIMIGLAVFSICGLALMSMFLFATRSFVAMSNYAVLDKVNRQAMDKLTAEIRQAKQINNFTTNPPTLNLVNGDGLTVVYTFNPKSQQMVRDASDGSHEVLLTNCSLLNFYLYKRNPSNANYGIFPVATADWKNTAKVIELTWKTAIALSPTAAINSENVQTARIVIRKAQTTD